MMDNSRKRDKWIAVFVALILHSLVLVGLLFVLLPKVEVEEQGAVLVNIGSVDLSSGTFIPAPIESTPPPVTSSAVSPPVESSPIAEEVLTQEDSEAPVVSPPQKKIKAQEKVKPQPPKEVKPTKPIKKPVDTSVQKQKEEALRAEQQRREAELQEQRRQESISKSVSGAFGAAQSKGSGSGDAGNSREGSPDGNVSHGGTSQGVGGFGSFSLDGRSLRGSVLPKPAYTSQIEGTIVVKIVVNPDGKVISTSIAPGTNIADTGMRNSAMKAAASAQFNVIDGVNNQTGTITYKYRLR